MALVEQLEITTQAADNSRPQESNKIKELRDALRIGVNSLKNFENTIEKLDDPRLSSTVEGLRQTRTEIYKLVPEVIIWERSAPKTPIIPEPEVKKPQETKFVRIREIKPERPRAAISVRAKSKDAIRPTVRPTVPDGYIDMSILLGIIGRSDSWWHKNRGKYNLPALKIGRSNYYSREEAEKFGLEFREEERSKAEKKTAARTIRTEMGDDDKTLPDSIRYYLQEIAKYSLLKAKDEKRIGARIFSGQLATRALSVILRSGLLSGELESTATDFLDEPKIKNIGRLFETGNVASDPQQPREEIEEDEIDDEIEEEEDKILKSKEAVRAEIVRKYDGQLEKKIRLIKDLALPAKREALETAVERYIFLSRQGAKSYDLLVNSNLKLVVSIAKKYMGQMPFEDLIAYGNPGLMIAAGKFDFRIGFKFSTYSTWWIRQNITRSIADFSRSIRVPVHAHESLGEYRRTNRRMVQELGREPTVEEVLEEMGEVSPTLRQAIIADKVVSLNMEVGEDRGEGATELGDFIEDPNANTEKKASQFAMREAVLKALDTLTPREQKILKLRYGLEDGRSRTLEEVGREFDVTRERIRQIEAKALRKLRHPSRSRKLRDFMS
ncbi:MAG: sigma-70 family RNA polymerase sigma factor [Patescibacteria group bacterium]